MWAVLTDPAAVREPRDSDTAQNTHALVRTLALEDDGARLTRERDNNRTPDAGEHSRGMWEQRMRSPKDAAERPT